MLKILGISVCLGFLSTWFSSPHFWRYKKIVLKKNGKKVHWDFKEICPENDKDNLKVWLHWQKVSFVVISVLFLFVGLCDRLSLFCGAILLDLVIGFVSRLFSLPNDDILSKQHSKKALLLWGIVLVIYILLFIDDNIQFRFRFPKLSAEYETLELSEVLPDENFNLSKDDLFKLWDCSDHLTYYVNDKIISYSENAKLCFMIENNQITFIDFGNEPNILFQIWDKNPKKIGFTVDDENNPYFVFALLKKNHVLGKYLVDQYALYNPTTHELTYWDTLPDYARATKFQQ